MNFKIAFVFSSFFLLNEIIRFYIDNIDNIPNYNAGDRGTLSNRKNSSHSMNPLGNAFVSL